MKCKWPHRNLRFGFAAFAFGLWLGGAPALLAEEFLVKWGGNYLPEGFVSSLNLDRGEPVPLEFGDGYPYNVILPKSPAGGRYNLSGPSAIFYGAFQTSFEHPPASKRSQMQLRHLGGENGLVFGSDPGAPLNPVTVRGLVFWKSDGFLDPAKSISELAQLSEFTLNVLNVRGKAFARFAVQSGGQWYLSADSTRGDSKGATPVSLGEFRMAVASSQWAVWPLTESASELPALPESFSIPAATLREITAVGFYFESTYSASNAAIFEINSFRVSMH